MTTRTNAATIGTSATGSGSSQRARSQFFPTFARWSARVMGSHWSFIIATALCILWAVSGPFFDYSDTWQLVINTATTVLTFLAVFLIQNTQNRDGLAIQLKLDELLRAVGDARTRLVNLEECTDEELEELRKEFERLQKRERQKGAAAPAATQEP
jgi:low affinity Fe/Cu permease